jgi:hypothetical protein
VKKAAGLRPFPLLAAAATITVLAVALFGGYTYRRRWRR